MVKFNKSKKGLSEGLLYFTLFVLTVAFIVIMYVPKDAWPDNLYDKVMGKVDINKINIDAPAVLYDSDNCARFSEDDCIANMDKKCVPYYSEKDYSFLDCHNCPKFLDCEEVAKEEPCNKNPCGVSCIWVIGEYKDGYTLNGKCIRNTG